MSNNNKREMPNKKTHSASGQMYKNDNDTKYNSIPNIVFTPFKLSKKITVSLAFLSATLILIFGWYANFEAKDLKEISQFSLNTVLVIGAMGIAIFAIPFDISETNNKNNRKEIVLRFIGDIGIIISGAVFCYVLSYILVIIPEINMMIPFFNVVVNLQHEIIKTFCILAMIGIANSIAQTFATIVAYFNIRD